MSAILSAVSSSATHWWQRDDLAYDKNELVFAGRKVLALAQQQDSPSFFYSAARLKANAERLHAALQEAGLGGRYRLLYAMKANRFAPLLTYLKTTGLVGIDACSPNEVEHALSCGFSASEISFTNTSLSQQDYDRLARWPGLSMNVDSLTAIRQWGERYQQGKAGKAIGIRINPAVGLGRADNDKLQYSGANTSKFGIYKEQFPQAIALAEQYGLVIRKIHFHTGCGYLTPQLACWEGIIEQCLWFVDQLDTVKIVNVGGGLGVPHVAEDKPLDLSQWAAVLKRQFASRDVTIEIEPGDYLVKDCGILVMTVNTVEQKKDKTFVGVNAGFNIALEPTSYGLPFQPIPALKREGDLQTVSIAGHINEALDVFYHDIALTPLAENDTLVLMNAGAYSTSMASNHCMRGDYREFMLF